MPFLILIGFLILIPFVKIAFSRSMAERVDFLEELYDTVITMTTVGYG